MQHDQAFKSSREHLEDVASLDAMSVLKNVTGGCSKRHAGKAKRRFENRAIRGVTLAQAVAAKKIKAEDGSNISDVVKDSDKADEDSDVEQKLPE